MNIQAELDAARELVQRIDAMVNAPYWTSERRNKIGLCAQQAARHITNAQEITQILQDGKSIPTCISPAS